MGIWGLQRVQPQNAVSVSLRENEDTHKNEAVKLSIFGIIPSVTYNFSF